MLQLHIEAGRRRCLQPWCALTATKQRSALGSRLSCMRMCRKTHGCGKVRLMLMFSRKPPSLESRAQHEVRPAHRGKEAAGMAGKTRAARIVAPLAAICHCRRITTRMLLPMSSQEHYIDYKGLKDLIKACQSETTETTSFSPRTTSLTIQRYSNKKDSAEERFFAKLEQDVSHMGDAWAPLGGIYGAFLIKAFPTSRQPACHSCSLGGNVRWQLWPLLDA